MSFKNLLILLCGLIVIGCASTTPGKQAEGQGPINIYVERSNTMSSPRAQYFTFTAENNSEEWVRIKRIDLDLGKAPKGINVLVGQDLIDWAQSAKQRVERDRQNVSMATAGVFVLGTIAAVGGVLTKNDLLKDVGLVGVGVGATAAATKQAIDNKNALERPDNVPDQYIHAPGAVGPKETLMRWAVLTSKKEDLPCSLPFIMELEDGTSYPYTVELGIKECIL